MKNYIEKLTLIRTVLRITTIKFFKLNNLKNQCNQLSKEVVSGYSMWLPRYYFIITIPIGVIFNQ